MVRSIFLFSLCYFISLYSVYGQEFSNVTINDIDVVDVKIIKARSDTEGNILLYYEFKDHVIYEVIDKFGSRKHHVKVDVQFHSNHNTLGIIDKGEYYCSYFEDDNDKGFEEFNLLTIHKQSGNDTLVRGLDSRESKKEEYIIRFSDSEKMFLLTANKKKREIRVNIYDGSTDGRSIPFSPEIPKFWKHFNKKYFHHVDNYTSFNIVETRYPYKIYKFGDQIYLSWDEEFSDNTEVLTLDLNTGLSKYIKIVHEDSYHSQIFNTRIFEDKLFKTVYSNDKFDFSVYDLASGKILKRIELSGDEPFHLSNGQLIRTGPKIDSAKIFKFETTTGLLSKLHRKAGEGGIALEQVDDSTLNIMLGSSYIKRDVGSSIAFAAFSGLVFSMSGSSSVIYVSLPYSERQCDFIKFALSTKTYEIKEFHESRQPTKYSFKKFAGKELDITTITVFNHPLGLMTAYTNRKNGTINIELL